jgi:phosphatidylglycerophosphatase A
MTSQPDYWFMKQRLSRWVAFGFGSGLSKAAPGTVGTLLAWLIWVVALQPLSEMQQALVVLTAVVIGLWACGRVVEDMGVNDHGAIVWDEIAAFWLVLWWVPSDFGWQFVAFCLFRLFDITKPPPIAQVDARVHGGFGVMADDLLAAGYAVVAVALIKAIAT